MGNEHRNVVGATTNDTFCVQLDERYFVQSSRWYLGEEWLAVTPDDGDTFEAPGILFAEAPPEGLTLIQLDELVEMLQRAWRRHAPDLLQGVADDPMGDCPGGGDREAATMEQATVVEVMIDQCFDNQIKDHLFYAGDTALSEGALAWWCDDANLNALEQVGLIAFPHATYGY